MNEGREKQEEDNLNASESVQRNSEQKLSSKRNLPALACGSLALAADLFSKHWAQGALQSGRVNSFLPPFVQFTLVTNTGAAFSMGNSNSFAVSLIATIVLFLLVFWYWRTLKVGFASALEQYGMAILIGGALGNLSERYAIGHVTDFLEFMFVNFPVFNVADDLIDVGIGLLILSSLLSSRKKESPGNS
jgi:signal peptidase II